MDSSNAHIKRFSLEYKQFALEYGLHSPEVPTLKRAWQFRTMTMAAAITGPGETSFQMCGATNTKKSVEKMMFVDHVTATT